MKLSIKDFNIKIRRGFGHDTSSYIEHAELKRKMGTQLYAEYCKWHRSSGTYAEGDAVADVQKFLEAVSCSKS